MNSSQLILVLCDKTVINETTVLFSKYISFVEFTVKIIRILIPILFKTISFMLIPLLEYKFSYI